MRKSLWSLAAIVALVSAIWVITLRRHRKPDRGHVSQIIACDATSAIVLEIGSGVVTVSRVTDDDRSLWTRRIPGELALQGPLAVDGAIYVAYKVGDKPSGDAWLERVDFDGRLRWRHLIDENVSLTSAEAPTIIGNTLVVPVWTSKHTELRAFDRRTGWPLWRSESKLAFGHVTITNTKLVTADGERLSVIDALRGTQTITKGLGDGCVVNDELLLVRRGKMRDLVIGLPHLDIERRRIVSELSTHEDDDHATDVQGCGTYGDRTVLMLRHYTRQGPVSTTLLELAPDGTAIVEKELPLLSGALQSKGLNALADVMAGEQPRYVVVALETDYVASSFAVLDLQTGELIWKAHPQLGDVEIYRADKLWFVTTYLEATSSVSDIVIDGTTGQVVGSAAIRSLRFDIAQFAAGTVWAADDSRTHVLAADARSFTPIGLRAHLRSWYFGSDFRKLTDEEKAAVGL